MGEMAPIGFLDAELLQTFNLRARDEALCAKCSKMRNGCNLIFGFCKYNLIFELAFLKILLFLMALLMLAVRSTNYFVH